MAKMTFNQETAPPNHRESELSVIGAIVSQPRRLFDVRALLDEGEVFCHLDLQTIYRACLGVVDAGLALRPLTIIQHLRKTGQEAVLNQHTNLHDLQEYGGGDLLLPTVLYLRELFIARLALTGASQIVAAVLEGKATDELLIQTRELADSVSGKTNISRDKSIAVIVRETLAEIQAAASAEGGFNGVDTGCHKLNRATGGWQTSDMAIIAGRPGSGKTVLLTSHAKAAAISGVPACIVSVEVNDRAVTKRLIAAHCNIYYSELMRGRFEDGSAFAQDDWKRIIEASAYIESLPLHIITGVTDINDITYKCLDLQQRFGIGLIALDYCQRFDDRTVRGGKAYDVVSAISKKCKDLNIRAGIPVLLGSQFSRKVEERTNKRPELSDLRESGKLEEDADIVVGLYRDDYYKLQQAKTQSLFTAPEYDFELEYDFLKFRNGPPRMARLFADVRTNLILDDRPAWFDESRVTTAHLPSPVDPKYLNNFPDDAHLGAFGDTPLPPEEDPF